MITIDKQFINFCARNQNFIRENFSVQGGSVIHYKKTGITDILQPSITFAGFDYGQIQKDCYILPTLQELVDYFKKFIDINNVEMKYRNGEIFVILGKEKEYFKGSDEKEALLRAIVHTLNKKRIIKVS